MQLQEQESSFRAAGIGVVAMTYDAPEIQKAFATRYSISYPLLADVEAASVRALGVLNAEYGPDHAAFGVAHPGVFVVNTHGVIVGKVFVEGYESRVDARSILDLALERLADSATRPPP